MSKDRSAETSSSCASCGKAEVDDLKLKKCDGCDLVRYCSDECLTDHKSQHEEACSKRAAELRDEVLFKQPESTHLGDCPICFLPFPLDVSKRSITSCCSKRICNGCMYANTMREMEASLKPSCPFCRNAMLKTNDEEGFDKRSTKRIEANNKVAICREGMTQHEKGEYKKAFEWFAKAAELGCAEAHRNLSYMYSHNEGVEKDRGKEIYHAEGAAIRGHPEARHGLGYLEWHNGNKERAVKHWIIAATQGEDESIKRLMIAFKLGFVSKEVLAATLRAHQAAVDETKSPQREAAEKGLCNFLR